MVASSQFEPGASVRISGYGPFRGLRGIIRKVDHIPYQQYLDEPHKFYLIDLQGAYIKEPIWFEYDEVEPSASYEWEERIPAGQIA
ncbi:hypothetical protein EPA93_12705 [Ktedonosporobacter rubrisoli]|uniref:Uncharacterized protein n=1 Tax=Ktedonosporobacter rubrisoli TaxID=2509675 RepID=A0A4P6JND0_KTERU|nr:KOW motif-containing protein [Ktedonosporobacter rubrisoli]QBD76817.1 hypothetical protein EPA93_12705 [Ktedonosporobacter rubrisoli]